MKLTKNLVYFLALFLFIILIINCDLNGKEPNIIKLSDSRFNGEFRYSGVGNKFDCLEFNGKYRYRLWSEFDSGWIVDWSDYSFSSDGTKLYLQSRPGSTITFTCEKRK